MAMRLSEEWLDSDVRENPVTAVLGAAAAVWLRNNPRRIQVLLVNTGANVIYVGLGGGVNAANGIPVAGNGGNLQLLAVEDGELVRREWWGICPAGANAIYVTEVVRK